MIQDKRWAWCFGIALQVCGVTDYPHLSPEAAGVVHQAAQYLYNSEAPTPIV